MNSGDTDEMGGYVLLDLQSVSGRHLKMKEIVPAVENENLNPIRGIGNEFYPFCTAWNVLIVKIIPFRIIRILWVINKDPIRPGRKPLDCKADVFIICHARLLRELND